MDECDMESDGSSSHAEKPGPKCQKKKKRSKVSTGEAEKKRNKCADIVEQMEKMIEENELLSQYNSNNESNLISPAKNNKSCDKAEKKTFNRISAVESDSSDDDLVNSVYEVKDNNIQTAKIKTEIETNDGNISDASTVAAPSPEPVCQPTAEQKMEIITNPPVVRVKKVSDWFLIILNRHTVGGFDIQFNSCNQFCIT
jgi:hypothetical protein